MKFVVVNTKSLGYRQTHLSAKKMNNMNTLELFSLLPTCIVKKITSNLSITRCSWCRVTRSCKYPNENYCSECKLDRDMCCGNKTIKTYATKTWERAKNELDENIGFIVKHRYTVQDGNEVYYHYNDFGGINPQEVKPLKIISHSICFSYIKIAKVLKKSIHFKMDNYITNKNTTTQDIYKWLNKINEISDNLPKRKASCFCGQDTHYFYREGLMVNDGIPPCNTINFSDIWIVKNK